MCCWVVVAVVVLRGLSGVLLVTHHQAPSRLRGFAYLDHVRTCEHPGGRLPVLWCFWPWPVSLLGSCAATCVVSLATQTTCVTERLADFINNAAAKGKLASHFSCQGQRQCLSELRGSQGVRGMGEINSDSFGDLL